MLLINILFCKSTRRGIRLVCMAILLLVVTACNEEEPDLVFQSQINKWEYISDEHGLASNFVNALFEDSKGNIWIGTDRGVSVLSENQLTNYSIVDGLLDNNVFAISEDKNGYIWLGTRRGINVLIDQQWRYYNYFLNVGVYALINLKNDEGMLIGTGGYGIYHRSYETNTFTLYDYIEDCEGCNSINSLFQSKDGSVWVASFGGARKIRGNFITQFDQDDGLPGNIATTIAEDTWGNIWVGTANGKTISRINGNTVTQVTFNNGAEQNFIFGIQEDNDGNLWVGTVGNGLFHYDGAIMKQIYEGPPDNTITAMLKDRGGNLWIGTTEAGVAVYVTNPN